MIPDCDGRSDGQTVRQTESIIANTALCIARAMLTRCKNCISSNSLTSVLCVNIYRLCVPNIMSLGICFILKNCTSSKLARLLDTASKFALFSASGLKDEKLIKKQTHTKIETCKLYSRVF